MPRINRNREELIKALTYQGLTKDIAEDMLDYKIKRIECTKYIREYTSYEENNWLIVMMKRFENNVWYAPTQEATVLTSFQV